MQSAATNGAVNPTRYFENVTTDDDVPGQDPVCLYLETTNRCNLLCTTCPRTYEELEPPADMSWELFTSIVDQIPHLQRAVLHGVGEPMLVKHLPRMVRYLKDRGTYVLFNTNGTVLNEKNGRALIAAGLDELRVSFARWFAWNSIAATLKPGHAKMPFMNRWRSGIFTITSTILRSISRKSPAFGGISTEVIDCMTL